MTMRMCILIVAPGHSLCRGTDAEMTMRMSVLVVAAAFLLLAGTTSAAPTAGFSGTPLTGQAPLAVTFKDLSTGSPTGWAWFFGDETYTAAWTRMTASPGWEARQGHSSVVMPDGSIVLTGGYISGHLMNDTWRSTDKGVTWTRMNASAGWESRLAHSSVAKPDGSIVLMGGSRVGGKTLNDTWRSTDNGATWMLQTAAAGWPTRESHSSVVMLDGSILLMGGFGGYLTGSWKSDVWRSTDNGTTWTQVNASAVCLARNIFSSVAMPDNSVVLMGGSAPSGQKNDVWKSTDNGATWKQVNASAGWSVRYGHTSVVMPDGSIVLMGGYSTSSFRNDVWRSTDNGRIWYQLPNAGWAPRGYQTSVAMPDGSIVLTGGGNSTGFQNDVWRFNPAGSSSRNPLHTYIVPGIYPVTLQVFNAGGSDSMQKTGYITVNLPSLPGCSNPPTDPDGDGIYEDLNGNGRLDFADVVLYFNQMQWIAANEPLAAFDLNGNGRIDFADVVALFNEI